VDLASGTMMIDSSFQLLACRYLHTQLEKLQEKLSGAKTAKDIECVHQSRVASRRMRAGLNFFDKCLPDKKTKKWRSHIRRVTKKLGQARDRDVQIEFIKAFLSNLDNEQKQYKRGIKRLLLRLEQNRRKLQPKIVKNIDAFNDSGILADMHGEIEKVLFHFIGKDISLQSQTVFEHTRERVNEQRQDLLSHQDSLENPSDKGGHHQMRISAKRLRYTLEICDRAFDGELKEMIKAVKKVQTSLGDIHDCDVWEDYLEQFIPEEKQKMIDYLGHSRTFAQIQKGLDYFHTECAKRRHLLFEEFVEYWNKIGEEGLWDKMQSIIDTHLEEYHKPPEMNVTV
jgi:CHAD domain-containing protein